MYFGSFASQLRLRLRGEHTFSQGAQSVLTAKSVVFEANKSKQLNSVLCFGARHYEHHQQKYH